MLRTLLYRREVLFRLGGSEDEFSEETSIRRAKLQDRRPIRELTSIVQTAPLPVRWIREGPVVNLDNPFTTALGILWWLIAKIALGSLLLPGVLIVSAVDVGIHLHLTTDQLWIFALLTNTGLCGVWYMFFDLSTLFGVAQTQFFIGLLLALASLFCHFGLHIGFFLRTFQRFSLFNFGM